MSKINQLISLSSHQYIDLFLFFSRKILPLFLQEAYVFLISRDHQCMDPHSTRKPSVGLSLSCPSSFLFLSNFFSFPSIAHFPLSRHRERKRERVLRRATILVVSPMNVFSLSLLYYIFFFLLTHFSSSLSLPFAPLSRFLSFS